MCVILSGTTQRPTQAELLAAELQNPDGAGIAWVDNKAVHFRKGLTADEVHEVLSGVPQTSPWVIHFRFATVGEPSAELCHPFPISPNCPEDTSGTSDRVLFHNGTISGWRERLDAFVFHPTFQGSVPPGEWSDSRGTAFLLGLHGDVRALNFIDGKFAVVSGKSIDIFPTDLSGWTNVNGVLMSNTYWRKNIGEAERILAGDSVQGSFFGGSCGSGFGRSLVDEAQDLLDEVPPSMPKKPTKKATKKKATKRRAPRKGLNLRQG